MAALIAATCTWIGCGNVYRPVSTPLPVTTGNPSGPETEVVLNQCPTGSTCLDSQSEASGSVLTSIDVSGDSDTADTPLRSVVGSTVGPVAGSMTSPMAFDYSRSTVYTANTPSNYDSVTLSPVGGSTNSPPTLPLPTDSNPISVSFQYFGSTYTQDYVVNSGLNTVNCPGVGSLSVIDQATSHVSETVCVGVQPVFAWIFHDQTKVYVLDYSENQVYVVNATSYQKTKIAVGAGPIKAAQSNNGQYIYVLNSGDGSVTIIDGNTDTVAGTVYPSNNPACGAICTSPLVDIAMDSNFNDTSANSQINHVWLLHANGTVSIYDGRQPGALNWITSLSTITAQTPAGAYPTNLALLRDGTWAYVGLGNTDQIVGIDTSKLSNGVVTQNATTAITLGVSLQNVDHTSVTQTLNDTAGQPHTVLVETTTPIVNSVAVSRQGNSDYLSKAYATTTTNTTYYCYDSSVNPTDCNNADPWDGTSSFLVSGECTDLGLIGSGPGAGLYGMSCPNLYNGTAVVTAAADAEPINVPINTYVKTIPAPSVVTYCNPGIQYDGQKNCPVMIPEMVLGRN